MDTSGRADVVTSGLIVVEQSQEEQGERTLQSLNHPLLVGSSEPSSEQSPKKNISNALILQESVNHNSGHENRSQILKSQSDSDESNESGSLPSKSSSTIDSSGSLGNDDRVAAKSGNRLKSSKRKKDRSKLRKGKWTVS